MQRDLKIINPRCELSLDANQDQILLGDPINLSLTIGIEATEKLADILSRYQSIELIFRNISPGFAGKQPYGYVWRYSVNNDKLNPEQADYNLAQPFGDLIYDPQSVSLADKKSIQLNWQVAAWKEAGIYLIKGAFADPVGDQKSAELVDFGPPMLLHVIAPVEQLPPSPIKVTLQEARREPTADQNLWALIRHRTINFDRYTSFINELMCDISSNGKSQQLRQSYLPFSRVASYTLLKNATDYYLMQEAGLAFTNDDNLGQGDAYRLGGASVSMEALREDYLANLEGEGMALPYFKLIRKKLGELPLKDDNELGSEGCYGILKSRVQSPPLMELIWSYWHEEGGLVQTMNAISLRFQNVRRGGIGQDPLANLNVDPLRPLGNMLWGYIEDERNRLTLNRRNLEYRYEYGYSLIGKAVQNIPVAENRTNFQRGFHSLLRAAVEFYQQANYTTIIPDGFPLLNNLREVHLLLAEGAHNQYGDLPWTARSEMLTQQWLLARPEVRDFLGGRVMVPYSEAWMDRVDNMKQLQGWNPANISHFRDLGTFGEQLLLSIRYGSWNGSSVGASNAGNWAHYWREEIQRYLHAYKAVTGVDIASDIVDARITIPASEDRYQQPGALIERQNAMLNATQQRGQIGAGTPSRPLTVPIARRLPLSGV